MNANPEQRVWFRGSPELALILCNAFFANAKILSCIYGEGNDRQPGHSDNSPCSVSSGLVIGTNKYMLKSGRN